MKKFEVELRDDLMEKIRKRAFKTMGKDFIHVPKEVACFNGLVEGMKQTYVYIGKDENGKKVWKD